MPADNVGRLVPLLREWTMKEDLEKERVSSSYLSPTESLTGRTSNVLLYCKQVEQKESSPCPPPGSCRLTFRPGKSAS